MLPRPMARRLSLIPLAAAAAMLAGCGSEGIQLAENDPYHAAAVLFQQRCAACHTFEVAGAEGSAFKANSRERKDGPNFNVRAEDYESVIYAIRNGGFSSGPMPQNLVVGREAELVACFVASFSGRRGTEQEGAEAAGQTQQPPAADPTSGQSGDTALPDIDENCP
jgi:mono/diheme cytochrome c family protein